MSRTAFMRDQLMTAIRFRAVYKPATFNGHVADLLHKLGGLMGEW